MKTAQRVDGDEDSPAGTGKTAKKAPMKKVEGKGKISMKATVASKKATGKKGKAPPAKKVEGAEDEDEGTDENDETDDAADGLPPDEDEVTASQEAGAARKAKSKAKGKAKSKAKAEAKGKAKSKATGKAKSKAKGKAKSKGQGEEDEDEGTDEKDETDDAADGGPPDEDEVTAKGKAKSKAKGKAKSKAKAEATGKAKSKAKGKAKSKGQGEDKPSDPAAAADAGAHKDGAATSRTTYKPHSFSEMRLKWIHSFKEYESECTETHKFRQKQIYNTSCVFVSNLVCVRGRQRASLRPNPRPVICPK
jgi:hypothetical protein